MVLAVNSASRTITVDRTRLYTDHDQARAVARREGVDIGKTSLYASNRIRERLTLKVAGDAAFLIHYTGERALDVSPQDFASMSALTFDEFARQYRMRLGTKAELQTVGAWITVTNGVVTSLLGPPYS